MTKKAAIYARYSTDKQDRSSIDGQVKNCRIKAKEIGCEAAKIFKDEAMGGDNPNRPGFRALIEAMECGDYEAVIVDDVDRFSRDGWSLKKFTSELTFRGQFMVDCAGFDSRDETSSLVASIKAGIAEMELKKISRRVYRGVRERADKGFTAGGLAYGFKKPEIDPQTGERVKREWQKHQKDPATAPVVVEIFKMYASGLSPRAIASELNRRNIPSPGAHWNRGAGTDKPTDGKWRASGINAMLENRIYNGVYIWNRRKYRKNPSTGKRIYEIRPEAEWKKIKLPFKIVDDLLWTRVQKRRAEVNERSKGIREALKKSKGHSKCGSGRAYKYLLSGILKCEECGSNMVMRDPRRYKCASQCNGAESACNNVLAVRREAAEKEILGAVATKILSSDNIDKILRSAIKVAAAQNKSLGSKSNDKKSLQARIGKIEKQLGNLADAIATSGFTEALKRKHAELDKEHAELSSRLAVLTAGGINLPKLEVDLRKGFTKLQANIGQLATVAYSPKATDDHRDRLRTALKDFLGEVPVVPDYAAGQLVAHLRPTQQALALAAAGPSLAVYGGGTGRGT